MKDPVATHPLFPFCILLCIYISACVLCVLQGIKLIDLYGYILPGGYFAASLTYLCTDIVSEVYGHRYAKKFVFCGLTSLAIIPLIIGFDIMLPASADWAFEQSYQDVFGLGVRLSIAGFLCFLVAQNLDVILFSFFKKVTKGKHLWFRNNASTAISKILDCVIYNFVGFWSVYDFGTLVGFTVVAYVFYLGLAVLDTPIVYFGVYIVRKLYPELRQPIDYNKEGKANILRT